MEINMGMDIQVKDNPLTAWGSGNSNTNRLVLWFTAVEL